MAKLEDLKPKAIVRGIKHNQSVTVIQIEWHGTDALTLYFTDKDGNAGDILLYRDSEPKIEVVESSRLWAFDGPGDLYRLVSEARRIGLAYLFDPVQTAHTSNIDLLPHQITAVYESMLPRQPLRFLLADDPGAGKTIMAGLLIKELLIRGDLKRCLVVCPSNLQEQWQDEMQQRFNLNFQCFVDHESTSTGNWFLENELAIARLDKLARNPDILEKLKSPDVYWDLIVCDEAHKMSASYFGNEVKYTKRYHLGKLLSQKARHFLLMTATPHNGKDEDFQLFLALLDGDRFEGKFRDDVHRLEVSDLMRRTVKEKLYKFDGRPLFPDRIASTVPYRLSEKESVLYNAVTNYVRDEFNRAEALQNPKRAGHVGFALTILQRRLASSPEAIFQSLQHRHDRLQSKLRELNTNKRGAEASISLNLESLLDEEEIEDLEDITEDGFSSSQAEVIDLATAATTIQELQAEIDMLHRLIALADRVRHSDEDSKWFQLSGLLQELIFTTAVFSHTTRETEYVNSTEHRPILTPSQNHKLVIFTEFRDTLEYLKKKITTLFGKEECVAVILGGMGREERRKMQERFLNDPDVRILIATDAAGEGINLQRAQLMVNYDLPWNPNRLEQRFGRIHRIGQSEVCYLWNLVAHETREGDVYKTLLEKLDNAREALGGQIFDVLGQLQFEGKPLKTLLLEAIREGESPEVRERLNRVVENAVNVDHLNTIMSDRVLTQDLDLTKIAHIREEMERAEARRLQPHYVESFFLEAFQRLGGIIQQQELKRYQITRVPSAMMNPERRRGRGNPVAPKYERVTFDKDFINQHGQPRADFLCLGHPLLDATIDLILEHNQSLFKHGAVLVDERDESANPRLLYYLEHSVQDETLLPNGGNRVISKQLLFLEKDADGHVTHLHYAPHLDYRPLRTEEPTVNDILNRPETEWIKGDREDYIEHLIISYAIENTAKQHFEEVKARRTDWITKTRVAVKDRLTKEISYWVHRSKQLEAQEQAGKSNSRLNSQESAKRAEDLQRRLLSRMEQLDKEEQIKSRPPVVVGCALIIPIGLIRQMNGQTEADNQEQQARARRTQQAAARARKIVMQIERERGYEPTDREHERLGYDIESRDPKSGHLRFIQVKGRIANAVTITVSKNEILYSLNKPEHFILAVVEFLEVDSYRVYYIRNPFSREPDFGVSSVNYDMNQLIAKGESPD